MRETAEGREISGEHDNISENFELSIYRITCTVSYIYSIHHNVLSSLRGIANLLSIT